MAPVLEINQVAAGPFERFSLAVHPGEFVAVVGPVGSGRTTLASVIAGLVPPERGTVVVDGVDVTGADAAARARFGVGSVRHPPEPFPSLTVLENVVVAASAGPRWGGSGVADRAAAIVDRLGLGPLSSTRAARLGPLERVRLEVARAVAAPRRLIVVDELGAGIPAAEAARLAPALIATAQRGGAVVWFDNLAGPPAAPDRLVLLAGGRVLLEGAPEAVEATPEWAAARARDGGW